ncbi:MAG: lipopolysaccharide heptosyltransferase I [Epsilonproteobacteria bacterium]|nr:MAG: lipopolysaccharide heptosyltransferase I [Campylobacterota bacterium]
MNICIVKLSAMGDIVHAMVVLQYIKAKYKNAKISWIVEQNFQDILKDNQYVDNILPVNLKSIKTNKLNIFRQISLLKSFHKYKFDIIIDAQGLLKSAIVSKIISKASHDCCIFGFDKNSTREGMSALFYNKKVKISYDTNVILRNTHLFNEALNLNTTTQDINNKQCLWSLKRQNNQTYVLLVVGASKPNKIYTKEMFRKVCDGLEYDIKVVWANDYEKSVANYLSRYCKNVTKLKKLTIRQLIQTIANSALVIGGDTGPTHMAWGLNRPSLTIYGNTPHQRNSYTTAINQTISSSSKVHANSLNKDDFSIKEIDPNTIISKTYEILGEFKTN